jgi:hypothetical protein
MMFRRLLRRRGGRLIKSEENKKNDHQLENQNVLSGERMIFYILLYHNIIEY